jgi:hypothetical protein
VSAAGNPEVVPGDANPLEVLGSREHPPQQLLVVSLDLRLLRQGSTGIGNPVGKPVADPLQLAEVEGAGGGGHGLDPILDPHPSEPLGHQSREVTLQLPDLPPQLTTSQRLVCLEAKPCGIVSVD